MRRLAGLALAAIVIAGACTEAFEPPPSGGDGTIAPSLPSAEPTAEPAATPEPSPVEIAFADLPREGDAALAVRVLGFMEPGGSVLCGGGTCYVTLRDPFDPRERLTLELATGTEGEPGTMVPLSSGFADADFRVTAADGSLLRSGDHAWITGTWRPAGNTLVASMVEPGARPKLPVVETTLAKLKSRKVGAYVRVVGTLDVPFLLSCYGGTCNLYLEDGATSIRIEVRLGAKGEVRPNTMWPLRDNFRAKDLWVIDSEGRTTRAGERVVVEGWLMKTDDGDPYLDPAVRIVRRGG